MGRAPCCEKVGLKRGRWTVEEDEILNNYIKAHGEGSWRSLPKNAGLLRCGKSCRLRWINYLRSDLRRGNISLEEERLITNLHASLGNRWSLIASHLSGRTDNEIKNYWNSHLCRKILPSRRLMDPPITIATTIKKRKGRTSRSTMKSSKAYRPSSVTLNINNEKMVQSNEPPTKQQPSVDQCTTSDEDEMLRFINNVMDADMLTLINDSSSMGVTGELKSMSNEGKEAMESVSEQVEVGGASSSTADSFNNWNWDFEIEDGVLGFVAEEDDNILSWPWESITDHDNSLWT